MAATQVPNQDWTMSILNSSVTKPTTESEDYGGDYWDLEVRAQYAFMQPAISIAIVLGVAGIVANVLSLLAMSRTTAQMRSHYRLIQNLNMSDILICLSVILHYLTFVVNPMYPIGQGPSGPRLTSRCVDMVIKVLNNIGLNITLLTLMGMAVDHYIAIFKPLHYSRLMSKRRAIIMILLFWFIAIVCGFSDFLSAYPQYSRTDPDLNYCEFIYTTKYTEEFTVFAIAIIGLGVMVVLYIRVYGQVRRHQLRDAYYHEILPNKKAFVTTLFILGTFVLCWLPMCLFQITLLIQTNTNLDWVLDHMQLLHEVDKYLYDLMLLNTLFDPIIYAVRMREIRVGYRLLFRRCCYRKGAPRPSISFDASYFTLLGDASRPSVSNGKSKLDRSNCNGHRRDSKLSNGFTSHISSRSEVEDSSSTQQPMITLQNGETKV